MTYQIIANGLRPKWSHDRPKQSLKDRVLRLGFRPPRKWHVTSIEGRLYVQSPTQDWNALMREIGDRLVDGVRVTKWSEYGSAVTYNGDVEKVFKVEKFETIPEDYLTLGDTGV